MTRTIITINSRKFDQTIRRSWECELVTVTGPLICLIGEFRRDVEHAGLGLIRRGTISYEYFWLDRWYNVFRFHEPNGDLRNFYCNISMPPVFENRMIDFVDLDIDVVVWPESNYEILDEDEYRENALKFDYPTAVQRNVSLALSEVVRLVKSHGLPS